MPPKKKANEPNKKTLEKQKQKVIEVSQNPEHVNLSSFSNLSVFHIMPGSHPSPLLRIYSPTTVLFKLPAHILY